MHLGEQAKAVLPLLLTAAVRRPGKWEEAAALVREPRHRTEEMVGGHPGAGSQHCCGVAVAMVARGLWRRKEMSG